MPRCILHVDMDEFFAAIEKLDHPELRGRCLLIGGDPRGRGVVSTASYEARVFGCRSAMPMATALRLCPQAVVLRPRGQRYHELSEQIFEVLTEFTPLVEPLSIDEAFLDVTGCQRLFGPPERIARLLKDRIRSRTGLTASVGVAPNKFLAKLASDLRKPDGLVVIEPEQVQAVLDPLPVGRIWGIGAAAAGELDKMGVRTIAQLRSLSPRRLAERFGSAGEHFHRLAQGLDDREVTPDSQAKSIGQEQTFAQDVDDLDELRRVLLGQVEQVGRRLRAGGLAGRTVQLKIRYGDFTTLTRSTTRDQPTDLSDELWSSAAGLLEQWSSRSFRPLRLLGVSVSQLVPRSGRQLPLFAPPAQEKGRRLDQTLDRLVERFGEDAISRAACRRKEP